MFIDTLENYLRAMFERPVYPYSRESSESRETDCVYYELDQTAISVKVTEAGYSFDFPVTVAIRERPQGGAIGWLTSKVNDKESRIDDGAIIDLSCTEYIEKTSLSEIIISKELSVSIVLPIDAVREKIKYLTLDGNYSESQTKE